MSTSRTRSKQDHDVVGSVENTKHRNDRVHIFQRKLDFLDSLRELRGSQGRLSLDISIRASLRIFAAFLVRWWHDGGACVVHFSRLLCNGLPRDPLCLVLEDAFEHGLVGQAALAPEGVPKEDEGECA